MMEMKQVPISESEIIVKKDSEQEYQRAIQNQRRDARRIFFNHQIQAKLNKMKATEEEQRQIMTLFTKKEHNIDLDKLEVFSKYRKEMEQLQQILRQIEVQHKRRQRQCLPMQQIINNKFDSLTVISIQYLPKIQSNNRCRYSISAFELFRVVHANKQLKEVALKGVQVQLFEQFISQLNCPTHNQLMQQKEKERLSWIKSFSLPKPLQLSIDTLVRFDIQGNNCSKINDLTFFISLFHQVSDIIIWLQLKYKQNLWDKDWQKMWKCLKSIKRINIKIKSYTIKSQNATSVRSVLFGGLASFTELTQLSFNNISFSSSVRINDLLAIEQSLRTLFENNAITHLELHSCSNFPVFSVINTLQSIDLWSLSFRRQFGFMRELIGTNRSLKSIKCSWMGQEWIIDEKLFNQLQTLIIRCCDRISLGDVSSQTPSNIKHLQIFNSIIGRVDCLSKIFPKLANLTCIKFGGINFRHQLIGLIPPTYLEELHICFNNSITDKDLVVIDSKWPNLSIITLSNCSLLTEGVWSLCKFKGLMELAVDRIMLEKGNMALQMKKRGVVIR